MAFSTHDIVPDSPTNNFATMNVLDIFYPTQITLSEGNLRVNAIGSYTGYIKPAPANIVIKDGTKCYIEFYVNVPPTNNLASLAIGVVNPDFDRTAHFDANGSILLYNWNGDGNASKHSLNTNNSYGSAVDGRWLHQSIGAVFVDLESINKTISWYSSSSGSWTQIDSATIPSNITSDCLFVIYTEKNNTSVGGDFIHVNFGQDPTFGGAKSPTTTYTDANGIGAFYYQPPTGALALCTANLPDFTPTVTGDVPQDYFKAVKYTGQTTADAGTWDSGTSTSTITVGFQPDLVWLKQRDSSTSTHQLLDVVRGKIGNAASFSRLRTDTNAIEATPASDSGLLSMGSNGFTLGTDSAYNDSGGTYVAWCWKAGGAPTADNTATFGAMTANSVSLNGTLQSNYTPAGSPTIYPKRMSINTDAGFSIVKYVSPDPAITNPSVPHGLNKAPDFVIIKPTLTVAHWIVKHVGFNSDADNTLRLDEADQAYADSNNWGGSQVTNTVVPLGNYSNSNTNKPSSTHIMYCWHSVEGYSKFGSYTGNGSAGGPFVYCGFRPAWVMCKCISDATTTHTSWAMHDNARDSSNVMNKVLYANRIINEGYRGDASTAATDIYIDFLSNGFKVRSTKEEINDDGETYVFMAFAEQPFKYANAR
jgi:hypothetical protein